MAYYIDLKEINIDDYKRILKGTNFLPSWEILKSKIDENLDTIKNQDIQNLDDLKTSIASKEKIKAFAKQSGLPVDYLAVLRRVINGYHPKPNKIAKFPDVKKMVVEKLETLGIKHTLQLYDRLLTPDDRLALSRQTGIEEEDIFTLTKLTDLSRVKWVNHTFAHVLLLAGYDTAEKVANANAAELFERVKKLNEEKKLYPAHVGLNDMKRIIESAKTLSFDVQYD